ncbi:MAG: DUF6029 family protein [bacterium]|nr:DUF6029 family protein [bacterium]
MEVRCLVAAACLIALLSASTTLAQDEATDVYESTDAALEAHERETSPETAGASATEVISQFFPEVEEDEGTYPASEFLEHDFLLRRQGPAKGSYSGRLFTKYSNDKISDVTKWEKELELFLAYKDVTSYMRFGDVNAFAGKNERFRWEKGNVRFKHDSGSVTLGSFGALFGRGLALNMFEERFLEFDNEVEGIKVEHELGDAEITALHGTRHPRIWRHGGSVDALRIMHPLGDAVDVGVHGVHMEFPPGLPNIEAKEILEYDLIGADTTVRLGDFRGYVETVRLKRGAESAFGDDPRDFDGLDGRGYYATASYSIPGFSIAGEYKDYEGLLQPFSVLPPIRRWWEKAQAEPTDDVGYGFDMNLSPGDDGSQFAFHYAQDNSHEGNRPYTEFFGTYSGPTGRDFTYIGEYWKVNTDSGHHSIKRATLNQALSEDWLASSFLEHEKIYGDGFGYTDYIIEGELSYRSELNLIYFFEATTAETGDDPDKWKLFEIKWVPVENQEIHLLLGSRRKGFVCSGGVCREEPAFDGMRVDWLLRF